MSRALNAQQFADTVAKARMGLSDYVDKFCGHNTIPRFEGLVCRECALEFAVGKAVNIACSASDDTKEIAAKVAEKWAAQYPEENFPSSGTSDDCKAAMHARNVARFIADDIRKIDEDAS